MPTLFISLLIPVVLCPCLVMEVMEERVRAMEAPAARAARVSTIVPMM